MPQISLYIDEKTLKKVENAAKKQHTSISKWVAEQIRSHVEPTYPADFETLFGSVAEGDLSEPDDITSTSDIPRERL